MTISTTRHSIEEDQCDRESSGHTPCHTLPAQKAKKISATERAVATPHATHSPHRSRRRPVCDRESSGHTPCHTLPAQKTKKTSATERAVAAPRATHSPHSKKEKVVFNGRHVSRQPAKAVGTSDIPQSTRMKTVSSAARNTTVHNGSVCGSYYKEEGREGRPAARRDCSKKEATRQSQHQ